VGTNQLTPPFHFDRAALASLAAEIAPGYATAVPFPHVVIEGLFPQAIVDQLAAGFPEVTSGAWLQRDDPRERKFSLDRETDLPEIARQVINECNSQVFLEFLTNVTGIEGLIPDPYLLGGGLHQIAPGGLLGVHADFNFHTTMLVDRRLNMILYLNKDWQEGWGGGLELWDRNMSHAVKVIEPTAGRCVIFSTTDFSYHGHPDPLACPADRSRRSLALYYYSNGRPPGEVDPTRNNTRFAPRPGEAWRRPAADWRSRARRWVPPAVAEGVTRVRRRFT